MSRPDDPPRPDDPASLRQQVYELACEYVHDGPDTPASARLQALVCSSSEARRYFVEFMCDSLSLYDGAATAEQIGKKKTPRAQQGAPTPRDSAPLPRARAPFFRAWMLGGAVLCVAVIAAALWIFPHEPSSRNDPVAPPSTGPVARLTHAVGVIWQDAAPGQAAGAPKVDINLPRSLALGEKLQLTSGLVEIEYTTGPRIILQGPAEYVIGQKAISRTVGEPEHSQSEIRNQKSDIRNSGLLSFGKLTARVPPAAAGFVISSPDAIVTDLGTEFAILVERIPANPEAVISVPSTATEVHVLAGKVDVVSLGSAARVSAMDDQPESKILTAGQALRIGPAIKTGEWARVAIPAAPTEFVRDLAGAGGKVLLSDGFEAMPQGEGGLPAPWGMGGNRREPPISDIFVEKITDSPAAIFGHRTLRFWDEMPDPTVANVFAVWALADDVRGRPLTVRFDFRLLRADAAPRFCIGGENWGLLLGPKFQLMGQPAIASLQIQQWYRLTADIPPASREPAEMDLRLERLVGQRFGEPLVTRATLPPRVDENGKVLVAKNVFFSFAPSSQVAVGGIWELDNVEIRVK